MVVDEETRSRQPPTFWSTSSSPPEESLRSDTTGRVEELPPDVSRSAPLSLPWGAPGPGVPEAAPGPWVEKLTPVGPPDTAVATSRAIFPTTTAVDTLIWYRNPGALSAWFKGLANNASAGEGQGGGRSRDT